MNNSIILRFHSSDSGKAQINYIGRGIKDQKQRYYCFKDIYGIQLGEDNKFVFHICSKDFEPDHNLNINYINNVEWYSGGSEFDNEFRVWLTKMIPHKIVGRR